MGALASLLALLVICIAAQNAQETIMPPIPTSPAPMTIPTSPAPMTIPTSPTPPTQTSPTTRRPAWLLGMIVRTAPPLTGKAPTPTTGLFGTTFQTSTGLLSAVDIYTTGIVRSFNPYTSFQPRSPPC